MTLPEGLLLSFYGDDFTGSTDTMEVLANVGLRTALFLSPPTPEELGRFEGLRAVGVAGVSRSLTPAEMDREIPEIFARLHALKAPLFHVKVCSTFDSAPHIGSIGHTIEIGQRLFPSDFVPLVVGAPSLSRFCVFGNLFARSGPESDVFRLDRHPTMSRHPVTPAEEGDLRLHLARQTTHSIGLVDVLQLDSTAEHVAASLQRQVQAGKKIVLFDTLTKAHLASIGRLLWQRARSAPPLFIVGSSGVEYALTAFWKEEGLLAPLPRFAVGPVKQIAVVSGSCSPVTAQQIDWATKNDFAEVALDPVRLLRADGDGAALEAYCATALAAMQQGRSVILHTCRGPEDRRLVEVDQAFPHSSSERAGRRLGMILGRILRTLVERTGIRRAVVTGGDTCGYAAREMGITALEMAAPIAPGSPLCRIYAENASLDGMEILFKGGQVGPIDLFGNILNGSQ